jgi:hypothetical protein
MSSLFTVEESVDIILEFYRYWVVDDDFDPFDEQLRAQPRTFIDYLCNVVGVASTSVIRNCHNKMFDRKHTFNTYNKYIETYIEEYEKTRQLKSCLSNKCSSCGDNAPSLSYYDHFSDGFDMVSELLNMLDHEIETHTRTYHGTEIRHLANIFNHLHLSSSERDFILDYKDYLQRDFEDPVKFQEETAHDEINKLLKYISEFIYNLEGMGDSEPKCQRCFNHLGETDTEENSYLLNRIFVAILYLSYENMMSDYIFKVGSGSQSKPHFDFTGDEEYFGYRILIDQQPARYWMRFPIGLHTSATKSAK